MFAHYAVRRNIIHVVNITDKVNITCPQGQTSFSVILHAEYHAMNRPFSFPCFLYLQNPIHVI